MQNMQYKLGLDVGTASLGLVAVSLDASGHPSEIIHHALHIFSEPLLPAKSGGVGEPKKAARRLARQQRRLIERRSRRLRRIALLALLLDLRREDVPADNGQSLHYLRAIAVSEPVSLPDLLLIFLKLAKKRGYGGSFKAKKEGDEGQVEGGIATLKSSMYEAGCQTVGQYLAWRIEQGNHLKLKESGLYAHRQMIQDEFEAIWTEQSRHHPLLSESRIDPRFPRDALRPIKEQFFEAIFHQRPLKSVAAMVGNCALEPSLPRSPMAQPAVQAFRIEKQLADLRWGMGRNSRPLTAEQKNVLRMTLNDPQQITKEGKFTFKKAYEALDKADLMPVDKRSFNMERASRVTLLGNRTARAMQDMGVGTLWQSLSNKNQVRIINFLADLGSPEALYEPDWQDRLSRPRKVKNIATGHWETHPATIRIHDAVITFINQLVATGKLGRLADMGLETGRAGYSIKALNVLCNYMAEHGIDEHDASQVLYAPAEAIGEILMHLPPAKETGNVVVDVALRVMRRAVNDTIAKLGTPPLQIVVELSRDMGLGITARGEIENKITKNQRLRDNAKKELLEHGKTPTDINVLRYLLWTQQNQQHCPYCADVINFEMAFDGNATNFEHILPRTLTRIGKQRNHLVLAHRACNDAKADRTPFEAFGTDEERWTIIQHRAAALEKNRQSAKAKLLLLQDYEHEVLDNNAITDFSERQFAETSWIGKQAAQWLKAVCNDISVSRGTLSAHLRRIWKLETVIPEVRLKDNLPVFDEDKQLITLNDFSRFQPWWDGHKKGHPRTDRKLDKRIDHRHHLIDALVIAQTSRSLYQRMANNYKSLAERRQNGEPVKIELNDAPPIKDLRDKALELIRTAQIWHKPDRHPNGAFFQKTAYRKVAFDADKAHLCVKMDIKGLTDANGSLEKARKGISDIVNATTRVIIADEFERRIAVGSSVKEALKKPFKDPRYGTEMSKVRVYHRIGGSLADGNNTTVVHQISRRQRVTKHLLHDGYAYVSVIIENGKAISTASVKLLDAAKRSKLCGSNELRFYPNEMIRSIKSGMCYVIRQINAGATLVITPVTESRGVKELGKDGLVTRLSGKNLLKYLHVK